MSQGESIGPIGVFDSGVGGLTVLRRIIERLPGESTVYLGDTARVPYGTKSSVTVIRYAEACARTLIARGVKLLVVACNTASSHAIEALRGTLDIPVLGVIEPGAQRAVETSRSGRIGVVGTVGTIASGAYRESILARAPEAQVLCKPCPLFVPLAEEGWTDGEVPVRVAETYLRELVDARIDTLVLGCTHYPLLRDAIARTVGDGVAIVDSADATSQVVAETLDALGLRGEAAAPATHHFLVTDSPHCFAGLGPRFLGREIADVEWVDV